MNDQTSRNIPLAKAMIGVEEEREVIDTLQSGWLTHGDKNHEFEKRFAEYIGVKHAISMNSCASALHIALVAQGIKKEVIIPSFSFSATANAVVTAGATPVFADVDHKTGNIDSESVKRMLSSKTEAVLPVHFAGQSVEMDQLQELCATHNLVLIEDSAEAIGAEYKGRKTGSFGLGCFSFFPTKNMTTGEGGMLTTDDDALAEYIRVLIAHGISKTKKPPHPGYRSASLPGYNFRMSNILAAIGLVQLKKLDEFNKERRSLAQLYNELLDPIEEVTIPFENKNCHHVYQMYTIRVPIERRTQLVEHLQRLCIGCSVHFSPPIHEQTYYKKQNYRKDSLQATEKIAKEIVTLPLYPGLSREDVVFICDEVKKYFN